MPLGQGALGQFALGQFLQIGTASLIGVAATAFAGQITPSEVLSLTGDAATAAVGTVSGRDVPALTGAAATGATGALAPSTAGPLSGIAATGVAGALTPQVAVSLSGVSATGVAGTVTPQFGTLPGVASTGVAGQLAPSVAISPTGAFGTGAAGTVVVNSANLTGVAATGVAGALVPQVAAPLVGVFGTGAPGTFIFSNPVTLQPAVAFGLPGDVFDALSISLMAASVSATAVPGNIIVPRLLAGVFATGVAGVVRVETGGGVTPIACVIIGRGYEAFIDGRASYATIVGRDCGCNDMKNHRPEWFQQGDTWQLQGNLHYADGTPFNLGPGCSITWGLQNAAQQVVFTLSLNAGITVVDAAGGVCLITVTPAQSVDIPAGSYVDELQATDPSGLVSTQWQGPIDVKAAFFT